MGKEYSVIQNVFYSLSIFSILPTRQRKHSQEKWQYILNSKVSRQKWLQLPPFGNCNAKSCLEEKDYWSRVFVEDCKRDIKDKSLVTMFKVLVTRLFVFAAARQWHRSKHCHFSNNCSSQSKLSVEHQWWQPCASRITWSTKTCFSILMGRNNVSSDGKNGRRQKNSETIDTTFLLPNTKNKSPIESDIAPSAFVGSNSYQGGLFSRSPSNSEISKVLWTLFWYNHSKEMNKSLKRHTGNSPVNRNCK